MSASSACWWLVLGWLPMLIGVRRQGFRIPGRRPHGVSGAAPVGRGEAGEPGRRRAGEELSGARDVSRSAGLASRSRRVAGAGVDGVAGRGPRDVGPEGRRSGLRPGVARLDGILLLLTWISCVALTASALWAVHDSETSPRVGAGIALFLAGIALWIWGRSAWQAGFAQLAQVPVALVTRGPYRVLRHPLYLSTALAGLGQAVAEGSWTGRSLWLGLVVVLTWRAWREESLLHAAFGPEWEAYARRSWGFRTAPHSKS